MFFEDEQNVDIISDSITAYISFCEETIVAKKEVKIYSNTKPWVNKEMTQILKEKKLAYKEGDVLRQKELFEANRMFRAMVASAVSNW